MIFFNDVTYIEKKKQLSQNIKKENFSEAQRKWIFPVFHSISLIQSVTASRYIIYISEKENLFFLFLQVSRKSEEGIETVLLTFITR